MADGKIERPFVKLYRQIWRDPEFLNLDEGPQRAFMALLSQPNITLAGTLPLQFTKWARLAQNSTPETVRDNVLTLDERCFVVADEATEELLIRTVMKNDTLWNKSPKTQLGALRQCLKVESDRIRLVLADEVEQCLDMFVVTEKYDIQSEAKKAVAELRGDAWTDASTDACIEASTDAYRIPHTAELIPQTADLTPHTAKASVALGGGSGGRPSDKCSRHDPPEPNSCVTCRVWQRAHGIRA
jgi:hypothetical protein